MKKRKIFYFLKNKEEYDYMLLNNLIPKRGIVLIESTQEIYRNRVPYSGYSPLKENFDLIKDNCKEYTDSKYNDVLNSIKLLKSSINSNTNNNTDINKVKTKLSNLENKLSDLEFLVPLISSEFAKVATSGSYNDLIDKPTFKTVNGLIITGAGNIVISGESSNTDLSNYYTKLEVDLIVSSIDKVYDPSNNSGLGIKHLDNNVITQNDFDQENTIYVITYDFDLNGGTIEIPEGCVLEFDGGSLNNGGIVGNNTSIDAGRKKIFGTNITLEGTWNITDVFVEWYGAVGDGTSDDTLSIQKSLDFANASFIPIVSCNSYREYKISSTLTVYKSTCFVGNGSRIFLDSNSSDLTVIRIVNNEVPNGVFGSPHYQVSNMMVDGYNGGYNGYIKVESITQDNETLCRQNTIGISFEAYEVNVKEVQINHCYYGIYSNTSNTFINTACHVNIRHCYYGIYLDQHNITNSGENFKVLDSTIGNCVVAFYVYRWGIHFENCSIDYNGYNTKGSECTEDGAVHGGVRMTNCWIERGGIELRNNFGVPFSFIKNGILVVENTLIIDDSFKTYLVDVTNGSFVKSVMFTGCTFEKGPDNFDTYICPDNITLQIENCQLGHYNSRLWTQRKSNLIKNGDLKDNDTSAFEVPSTGTAEIVTHNNIRKLKINPALYFGYDTYVEIHPKKNFYLMFRGAATGALYVYIRYFDSDGKILETIEGSTLNDMFNTTLLKYNRDAVKIVITFYFQNSDSIATDYISGVYCYEF